MGQRAGHLVLAFVDFIVFSPGVSPASSFQHLAIGKQGVVARERVGLQGAGKARKVAPRMLALAVRGILEPHRRRRSIAAGSVVARIHPQPGRAGRAPARAQDRHGRVIGVELARAQDVAAHGIGQGLEQPRRAGHPVRQRGTFDHHALAGVDLALAVKGQVVAELAHQHLRDDAGASQAAINGATRRGRLHDRVAAGAGELGAHLAHDLEDTGLVLQHFGGVLANLAQFGAALLASAVA